MKASQLEASLEGVNLQLSACQVAFSVVESQRDQACTLASTELQKRHNVGGVLTEVRGRRDDHSYLVCSCHELFRFNVDQALHNYLRHMFDTARDCTDTFCAMSSS